MALPYEFSAKTLVDTEKRTTWELVGKIREWLKTEKFPLFCDELIVLFLLSCENNYELTLVTIKAYFRIKNGSPEIFNNRDMEAERLQKCMETIYAISIPERLEDNIVIHYFKLKDTNWTHLDLIESMKVAYMLPDLSQRKNPPNGLIVIFDCKGVGLMHLRVMKLNYIKIFLQYVQEAMPLKLVSIQIINANYVFDRLLSLIKMFMKADLIKKIHTHPVGFNMEEFSKNHVPLKCLPRDYGGPLPSVDELQQNVIDQFREMKQFFEGEEKMRQNWNGKK